MRQDPDPLFIKQLERPELFLSLWQNWRTEVHREHELISMRIGWMLVFHSFALTAFAIFASALITLHTSVRAGEPASWPIIAPMLAYLVAAVLMTIPLAGMWVTVVAWKAVQQAVERLRFLVERGHQTFDPFLNGALCHAVNAGYLNAKYDLEPNDDPLAVRSLNVPGRVLPWVFLVMWVAALLYGATGMALSVSACHEYQSLLHRAGA